MEAEKLKPHTLDWALLTLDFLILAHKILNIALYCTYYLVENYVDWWHHKTIVYRHSDVYLRFHFLSIRSKFEAEILTTTVNEYACPLEIFFTWTMNKDYSQQSLWLYLEYSF